MATLDDLEARVAALEATQADYRAVLAAVNALGANQREHAMGLGALDKRVDTLEKRVDEGFRRMDDGFRLTDARFRSVEEHLAELRDLIIAGRNGAV